MSFYVNKYAGEDREKRAGVLLTDSEFFIFSWNPHYFPKREREKEKYDLNRLESKLHFAGIVGGCSAQDEGLSNVACYSGTTCRTKCTNDYMLTIYRWEKQEALQKFILRSVPHTVIPP